MNRYDELVELNDKVEADFRAFLKVRGVEHFMDEGLADMLSAALDSALQMGRDLGNENNL